MSEKETILDSIRALTNRLLPGAKHYALGEPVLPFGADNADDVGDALPPPDWKRWTRPEKREPIDDAIATLISRRRVPKLKPKAALVGITCPFWYARAGVVMAVETAILTENEAKENRRLARQGTSELLRSRTRTQDPAILRAAAKRMGNSAKALSTLIESAGSIIENLEMVVLLEPSLYAALQANPVSLHARAQWRNDELFEAYIRSWDKFVDHANPLAEALVDIQKVARTGLRAAAKRMGNSAKALSTLIESAGSIIENLEMVVLLEPSLYAALQANPVSLHARAQWRNDELFEAYIRSWDKFVDHANPLAEALADIQKVARTGLLGASNNPPAYFQRTFVEKMAQSFASLTGAATTSGTVFRDFVTAAWTSAFPDLTEPAWERVINNLRAFDRP